MGFAFYLLSRKGFMVLDAIVRNEVYRDCIDMVVYAQDSGNSDDCSQDIFRLAKAHNIKVYHRTEDFVNTSDFSIAIGWRWLIKDVENLFVIHDSILPKYRGFSPLVNMLINKEEFIGATLLKANADIDSGPILFQEKIKVDYPIKIADAIERVSKLYVILVERFMELVLKKKPIELVNQDEELATYSIWRDQQDYFVDWNQSAEEISRFVDSVGFPYDGAKTYLKDFNTVLKISEAEAYNNYTFETNSVGKIFKLEDGKPYVACGSGLLKLNKLLDLNNSPIKLSKLRQKFL
jgi:methionyl-tRNA formyltransferase